MSSSEQPGYANPSRYGMAVTDVASAWDRDMAQRMRRGEPIVALRGAGSVNGIDPQAADRLLEEVLFPMLDAEPATVVFDGDEHNPRKPDIGYIAGLVHRRYGNVMAAQTRDWYYPPEPGSNLVNADGQPYDTFVIERGQYEGDHNRLTQSEQLARYPRYRQLYIGAAGAIANSQMVDYARKVPQGGQVSITAIRAENNGALTAEIGLQLAAAVTEKDKEKFQAKLDQRRQRYGAQWNNDGSFNREIINEIAREDDSHELVVLWDMDSRVEKVDIVNCRKVDLNTPDLDRIFADAPYYVKTTPVRARQIPEGTSETIIIKSGATSDTAHGGDWAVQKQKPDGTYGEEYPVARKTFAKLYDADPDTGTFIPKWDPRKLVRVNEDVIFMAPWGEQQAIRRGGYIMECVNADGQRERYGISQMDAESDFVRVDSLQ